MLAKSGEKLRAEYGDALIDGAHLSISKVSQIFAHVNTAADEEEEGDDDEAELHALYCNPNSNPTNQDEAELYSLYCSNITLLALISTLL